ncbi:MAG: tetratricopeptide repeat protein [Sandaracinaceae bacterium]|nr:tetratricopeptide repeat protein [Sandaracinaceae bacterium]
MSTKYLCVHCDKTFTHQGEKKPRCPECMRVNGLEEVVAPKAQDAAAATRPKWLPWAIGAGALVAVGVGYALWAGESADTVSGPPPLAPLDRAAVLGHLRNHRVDARELGELLVPSSEIESWARNAAGSGGARDKAGRLLAAIRARASAGAFVRTSLGIPRETPIQGPGRTLDAIREDGARSALYPLELAALMTAGLRAVEVPAMVAEAIRYEGDRSPPDPSGQFGYFVVAVYDGEAGQGEPTYYDPYLGREVPPAEARVLTDLQAIGAALSTRALYLLSRESDLERAVETSEWALRLDGSSPSARAVRGAVLISAGQPDQGLEELSSAKQLRTDAPRRNLVAGVHMAQGDLDAASREVSAALEQYPEFAPGRATLAAIHLARGEHDLARAELAEAERIDRDLHLLPQLWASYFATTGDLERAVASAEEAVRRNGDIQTRLLAARIYRQASQYDRMRREARAVLERMPPSRQQETRELIRRMLGPTALEADDDVEDDDDVVADDLADDDAPGSLLDSDDWDDEDDDDAPGGLRLDRPGSGGLLGRDRPSLLGGEQLGGGGGGRLGGGRPSLGGGGGGGLQLDLNR